MHGVCWGYWNLISIHAPPRGATGSVVTRGTVYEISIHAPPRGATSCSAGNSAWSYFNSRPSARGDPPPRPPSGACCYFNSRPSARGDLTSKGMQEKLAISIHAPPRGATCFPICWNCCRTFQFTPLREGRQQKICNFCKSFVQPSQITAL